MDLPAGATSIAAGAKTEAAAAGKSGAAAETGRAGTAGAPPETTRSAGGKTARLPRNDEAMSAVRVGLKQADKTKRKHFHY